MTFPNSLQKVKNFFKKFPGVGERTAERYLFDLLRWKDEDITKFAEALKHFRENVKECVECGALQEGKCPFCGNLGRNRSILCVVATPREIFSLESIRCFDGLYHVLGGTLSPLDPPLQNEQKIQKLKKRIELLQVKELFLGFDSTLDGDATAHYLKHELAPMGVKFTRPAFGLPMGSPIEGIDMSTLAKAFLNRSHF
jgi:recombination protein RecR